MNEEQTNATEDVTDEEEFEVTDIEAEGDHAADYIEELLDIADLDGDIDIEVRNNRTYLSVLAPDDDQDIQGLVGEDGKTLEALQELTRLAVLSSTGQRSRLILDIAGHRAQRADSLRELAREAIAKVEKDGGEEHMKPMSPYERKIVHDVVAESGLYSESEGEGPRRHVVISAGE